MRLVALECYVKLKKDSDMNFRTHMSSIRALSDDYYNNRVSYTEYREKRSQLLQLIDEELNGVEIIQYPDVNAEKVEDKEGLVDKALSFLNLDKQKKTS